MNIFRCAVIISTILFCGTALAAEKDLKTNVPATQQGVAVAQASPTQKAPATALSPQKTVTPAAIARYVLVNGMVRDKLTGLMWAAKDNGSDTNWANAKSYCENYRGGGYSGWRMPTQDELARLYDGSISGKHGYHLTNLIELTSCCTWASDMRSSSWPVATPPEVVLFDFTSGQWGWVPMSAGISRTLPVRSGK
jgi:hypothetical protein